MSIEGVFDYVIVGGGSAGATLAARLSEDPAASVCLLEAGGEGDHLLIRVPAGVVGILPGYGHISNWAYRTTPQPGLNGRRGYQPRGRCLGGSSAINAMLYVRGHRADYDGWAKQGCEGWSWDECLPYFRRSENNQHGADDVHGGDGPLQVSDQASPRPISRAFVEAARTCQHREIADFNTGDNEGAGLYQVTQFHDRDRRGERCSAAAAYLAPIRATRANLTVLTHAHATRILIEDRRAVGVAFRQGRRDRVVRARREVIVSGGAFGSPQLLMLSGIGPADEIRRHGIRPVVDLPGVGQNLQDHLDFTQAWTTKDTDNFGIGLSAGLKLVGEILKWRRDGTGMIATPFAEGAAFLKTLPDLPLPDVQLHFVISIVDDHARKLHAGNGYSCHVCALRPYGRGEVFLQNADPFAAPGIDPAYLSDPRDLATLIRGARLVRTIMQAPAMRPYVGRELFGVHDDMTDAEWEHHIRARADTIYHPVGTCRMGHDPLAVVDPQLRVRGVDGLRVVDASIMPTLIGGNTNAPTIMIAERAADFIRADAGADAGVHAVAAE